MGLILLPDTVLLNEEPIRKSWWSLLISDSPVGAMPEGQEASVRSMPDLVSRLTAIPTAVLNSSVNVPGVREPISGAITFHMYTNSALLRWWWEWWDRIWNQGEVALYGDIVGQGILQFYAPAQDGGDPEVTQRWNLVDIWPNSVSIKAVDQDSDGDPVGYEVELQIAQVKPNQL